MGLLLASSQAALLALDLDFRHVGQLSISGSASAISGQFLYLDQYLGEGTNGFAVVDVSDPTAPTLTGSCLIPSPSYSIAISGNLALVGTYQAGLQIIDVNHPQTPHLVGNYATDTSVFGVTVSGDIAYLAAATAGVQIVDFSKPNEPRMVGKFATPGRAKTIACRDCILFVADDDFGLLIFDVSNPAMPRELGRLPTPGWAFGVAVQGNRAYVADGRNGLQVIDISELSQPKLAESFTTNPFPSGSTFAVEASVSGDLLYVTDLYRGVDIFEGANSGGLRVVGRHRGANISLTRSGYCGFLPDGILEIIDTVSANPQRLGSEGSVTDLSTLAAQGNRACSVNRTQGLSVFDLSTVEAPSRVGTYPLTNAAGAIAVAMSPTHAFVAFNGVDVIDIRSLPPRRVGHLDGSNQGGFGLALSGTNLFWASGANLTIVDVTDPANPVQNGRLRTQGSAVGVAVAGQYGYVLDSLAGLRIADLTDIVNPKGLAVLRRKPFFVSERAVAVDRGFAFVVDDSALWIVDVSDPKNPKPVTELAGSYSGITIQGAYAYLTHPELGLEVIDIRDPRQPVRVGGNSAFSGRSIASAPDFLWISIGTNGLVSLQPFHPVRLELSTDQPAVSSHVRLSGPAKVPFRLQRSQNLTQWEDFISLTLGTSPVELEDSLELTEPSRYYRAVSP
jgi:hypothetical protein